MNFIKLWNAKVDNQYSVTRGWHNAVSYDSHEGCNDHGAIIDLCKEPYLNTYHCLSRYDACIELKDRMHSELNKIKERCDGDYRNEIVRYNHKLGILEKEISSLKFWMPLRKLLGWD